MSRRFDVSQAIVATAGQDGYLKDATGKVIAQVWGYADTPTGGQVFVAHASPGTVAIGSTPT